MQLSTVIGIVLCLCISELASADCHWAGGRHRLRFYEYAGTQTNEAKANFSVFRQMVNDEVISANLALSSRNRQLSPLSTEPSITTLFMTGTLTPSVSLQILQADSQLLELLSGSVSSDSHGRYIVHSDIYIAGAHSPPPAVPIAEDYRIDPSNYSDTRSLHLAATYYALALDAVGSDCRSVRLQLLNLAAENLADIKHPSAQITTFRSAIRAESDQLISP